MGNRETLILDKGYAAVRLMAKELVENGADVSDILHHANQVWHEFKAAAMLAGGPVVRETGMYVDQYNAELTNQLIARSARYKNGIDQNRVGHLADKIKTGEQLPPVVVHAKAKAGK